MTVINVTDMMCDMCVARITKGLTAAGLDVEVSLDTKTVTVKGDDAAVRSALAVLDDLGYEAAVA